MFKKKNKKQKKKQKKTECKSALIVSDVYIGNLSVNCVNVFAWIQVLVIISSNTETVSPVPKHEIYRDFSAVKADTFLLKKKYFLFFCSKH